MDSKKHGKVQVVLLYLSDKDSISDSQVLLLQMNKERGSHWQSVTGSVDPGENFEQAAKRELLEETGVECAVREIDLSFEFHDRWGKDVLEKVFFATVNQLPNIVISDEEHQNYKWINTTKVNESTFGYPSNLQALKKVLEVLN